MYTFKDINGLRYVIHIPSGCSLIYHSKKRKYDLASIPEYKRALFEEWLSYSNVKRSKLHGAWKKIKEAEEVLNIGSNAITYIDKPTPVYFDTCVSEAQTPAKKLTLKKKENTMCYDDFDCDCDIANTTTPEERKAQYLNYQLGTAYGAKEHELRKAFRMNGTPAPETVEDFFNRIKTGKFSIPKKWLNDDGTIRKNTGFSQYNGIHYAIDWDTPETAPDLEGYATASDKLSAAYKDTQRIIQIDTPMNGLAALKEFESKTFH